MSDIDDCIPDVPDIGASVDKAVASARGKIPNIDFTPVDFTIDTSKFFDFEFFGKLLGDTGLSLDVCDKCTNGADFDGITEGTWVPAQETVDQINADIQQNSSDIQQNAQNIQSSGGGGGGSGP